MPTKAKRKPSAEVPSGGPWFDWAGAAAYLGVTERWLRRRVYRDEIPFHRYERLIRFHKDDLDDVIAASRVEAKSR